MNAITTSIVIGIILLLNSITGLVLRNNRSPEPLHVRVFVEDHLFEIDKMIAPVNLEKYKVNRDAIVRDVESVIASEREGLQELDIGLYLSGAAAISVIGIGFLQRKRTHPDSIFGI